MSQRLQTSTRDQGNERVSFAARESFACQSELIPHESGACCQGGLVISASIHVDVVQLCSDVLRSSLLT